MKIKYTFADGTTTEVEVSEEVGAVVIESRKAEHAQDERQRYHCPYSYDAIDYEGEEYASDENPESDYLRSELNEQLYAALQSLTETQRRRLLLYAEGMSFSEIAKREGVSSHSKIIKSVESAQKIMKKFLDDGGRK